MQSEPNIDRVLRSGYAAQRLAELYEDIDTLLEATLSRDDHVDLNTLRVVATHPPSIAWNSKVRRLSLRRFRILPNQSFRCLKRLAG